MRLFLAALLVPMVLATGVMAVVLWPSESKRPSIEPLGPNASYVNATVDRSVDIACPNDPSNSICANVTTTLTSGADKNRVVDIPLPKSPDLPVLKAGDKIVLGKTVDDSTGQADYTFSDLQRKPALGWLAAAFAVLVLLVARWRGMGAIIGVFITWLVLTRFVLPAILEGQSPIWVAITGSAAIVLVVLYIAHGLNARTTTAVIATLVSLGLTAWLAAYVVDAAHISGFASEESSFIKSYAGDIDIRGLLLGGVVLGALGVLNDMTVSQTSTVREIHLAQPNLSRRRLYAAGMRVGRDHIASTVYTLVLAYVGAALPLLVLFTLSDRPFGDVVGTELVAEEVIRTLVGSIGLVLSVPLATALAAIVEKSRQVPPGGVAPDWHPHDSGPDRAGRDEDWNIPAQPEPNEPVTGQAPAIRPRGDDDRPESVRMVDLREPKDDEALLAEQVIDDALEDLANPPDSRRRFMRRRHSPTFRRHMSRRERRFWDED